MQSAKCVMVGDSAVGKSCLLVCYTRNVFQTYNWPSFYDKVVEVTVDDQVVGLHLWDTGSREWYDSLRIRCYKNINICIVCFSIASPSSYESVKNKWYPEVDDHCTSIPILLVGTKKDLRHNAEIMTKLEEKNQAPITTQQGIDLAEQIGAVKYMECSALNQEGIKEIFMEAARVMLNGVPSKQICSDGSRAARDELPSPNCVITGDSTVGKSCLLTCYTENDFTEFYPCFNNRSVNITVDNRTVDLYVWDTLGREEYETLRFLSYPEANVLIICFSIGSSVSYKNVTLKWYPEARQYCPNVPILLVGTKKDLRYTPKDITKSENPTLTPITTEQGIKLAKQIRAVKYMECSALYKDGIKEVFEEAARVAFKPVSKKRKRVCRLL